MWLWGSYFGGSTTTNKCESMNASLKRFLDEKLPLWRALQHCDHGLTALRHGELGKHVADKISTPILKQTSMVLIEEQFATIYTRNVFMEVRSQITRSKKYNIVRHHKLKDLDICTIEKYLLKDYPKRKVTFCRNESHMSYDCCWLETKGILCRHIFAVMKHLHLSEIPINTMRNRWLKDCKDMVVSTSIRYGGINEQATMLTYYCKKSNEVQERGMKLMSHVLIELQRMVEEIGNEENMVNGVVHEVREGIKEPHLILTKGRSSQVKSSEQNSSHKSIKSRFCRVCKKSGDDYRNCKVRKRTFNE